MTANQGRQLLRQHLKPAILGVIMEYYMSGAPLLADGDKPEEVHMPRSFDAADTGTVDTIKDLLETRRSPAIGDINTPWAAS